MPTTFTALVSEYQLKLLFRLVGYEMSISIIERRENKIEVSITCRNQLFLDLAQGVLYASP